MYVKKLFIEDSYVTLAASRKEVAMTSASFDYSQAKLIEKKIIHPYALQCLSGSEFVSISNKILAGEFGLISFRRNGEKRQFSA